MSEQPKRTETVEEYLQRGGTITRLPDSPNSFYGVELDTPTTVKPTSEMTETVEYKRVSWKDVEHDEKIIESDDQYWKELDRRIDTLMSKYS